MKKNAVMLHLMITLSDSKSLAFQKTLFNFFSDNSSRSNCLVSKSNNTFVEDLKSETSSLDPKYEILNESYAYKGWRNIISRNIRLPNGECSRFDIVSQKYPSIGVFVWDTKTSTATLIREYHPGVGKFYYGVIGGMYEKEKHRSPLESAKFELEEEAHLDTVNWIPLLEADATTSASSAHIIDSACSNERSKFDQNSGGSNFSISVDKYSDNMLYPYLAVDCKTVLNPRPLDMDEYIEIVPNVTYKQLMKLLSTGQLCVFSSYITLMSLRKLEELNIKIDKSK